MTKFTNLQLFLSLFSLVFFSFITNTQAQTPEKKINVMKICAESTSGIQHPGCTSGSYFTELDSDCKGIIYPNIYLTNIVEDPILNQHYALPTYLPNIYIQHEMYPENLELSGPYDSVEYIGLDLSASGQTIEVFAIRLELEVAFDSGSCRESGPNGVNNFTRSVAMVAQGKIGNTFAPYPIHKYSEPGQAFSCDDFYDTWCDCHDVYFNGDPCEEEPIPPVYDLLICTLCGSCGNDIGPTVPNEPAVHEKEQQPRLAAPAEVEVSELQVNPNPFDNIINFSFYATIDAPLTYTVYNPQGKMILQKQQNIKSGVFQSSINADDLSSGIYYLHIQHGHTQSVQKVIKL